jgi:putative ABC transport system permease protein
MFTLGLGLLACLLCSIVPAWRLTRLDAQALLQGNLQRGIGRRGRFGRSMISFQVALALVLVFGAVIAGRAFLSVLRVPLGFTPENVITIRVNPGGQIGPERQAFYIRAVERLAQRGDVISVGAAGSLPLDGSAPDEGARVAGSGEVAAGIVHVLPGYFEAINVPLVRGRLLNWDDVRGGASMAVISESAARRLFSGRDPIGASFTNGRDRQFIVAGVVADVRASMEREPLPATYVIPGQAARLLTLVVRARTRQEAALAAIRREISALAPGAPVTAEWWTNSISALTAYRNPRFQTLVLGAFAALALGLTALGIFGVVAFSVAARTHEMGVRLALGASPRSLVELMVKQTLAPVAGGVLIGLVATRWASRLAEAQLFQVETRDPATLGLTVLTVVAVALLAAYVPARRASRVDPMVVLRAE